MLYFLIPSGRVLSASLPVGGTGQTPVVGGTGQNPCPLDKLCNPIKYDSIEAFLLAILNVVVQYGAIIIVFFIVYAGFQFVTSQGNTEKIAHAKQMLVWVIVGGFVLLGVYVLRAAICGTLTQIGVRDLQC